MIVYGKFMLLNYFKSKNLISSFMVFYIIYRLFSIAILSNIK